MARPRYVRHRKFNRIRETAVNHVGAMFVDSNPTATITEPA